MTSKLALRLLSLLSLSTVILTSNAQTASLAGDPLVKPTTMSPKVAANYGNLPLNFEPNLGQTSAEVQWLSRGTDYTLFLAGPDAVLEMNKITRSGPGEAQQPSIRSSALRMNLVGAGKAKSASGEEPLPGKANYFSGADSSKWQRNVPLYGKVRLQAVYAGIDLVYYGHQGQLEYDFVVAPGADASAIRMKFDGASAKLAANGDLILPVADTEVRFHKPVVYQVREGIRQAVEGSFAIATNQQVSFKLGTYDHSRELIIDPTLLFLGTLGTGNQQSVPNGMAVDSQGEIILTGVTNDLTFPTTTGALQPSCTNASAPFTAGGYHRCGASSASSGFVTKISADGKSLIYSTYLHGLSGQEYGDSVAVDASGDAYVLGMTSSNDFPITSDAYQTYCQPYFPPNGFAQPQTYLPETSICNGYLPGGQFVYAGPTLFIAKLDPTGSTLLYSTFFGGNQPTLPVGLALDSSNNIYFASYLQNAEPANNVYPFSSNVAFPVTASAYQSAGVGIQSATLSKLSADGHTLLYSTLMGGITTNTFFGFTEPLALAVGQNGIAYLGGLTLTSSFPTTPGAVRPACVGNTPSNGDCMGYTGFLSAFDTTQSGAASLVYSTYIGGTETAAGNSPQTQVNGIAVDSSNNAYITGFTSRIDYPTTTGAYQTTCGHANPGNTCNTAFLTKINPTGTAYVWSTYYGGTTGNPPNASGSAIALDAQGRIYLYGLSSGGGDIPQVNPVQPWIGGNELFIAEFSPNVSQLLFATYVGDTSTVAASAQMPIANNGLALDASGNIYFAGETNGVPFVTTPGTYTTTPTSTFFRGFFGKISPTIVSTTTLTVPTGTVSAGQSATFTATVAGPSGTTTVPTGTVTFLSGSTTLGTGTLNGSGVATYTAASLNATTYTVTASYPGDTNFAASVSPANTLVVSPATATIKLTAPATATVGASVTLGVTVTGTSGNPTGTVVFKDGSTTLSTMTLAAGAASYSTSALTVGTHSITVSYSGDSIFASGVSTAQTVTISVAPAVTFAALPTSLTIVHGATGTIVITGTPVGGYTGTATFSCGPLPTAASCTFAPTSLVFSGSNTAQSTTLTIATSLTTAGYNLIPGFHTATGIVAALLLFPLGFARRRKQFGRYLNGAILMAMITLSSAALLGLTGCSSSAGPTTTTTPAGSYSIIVTITAPNANSTITLPVTVQ